MVVSFQAYVFRRDVHYVKCGYVDARNGSEYGVYRVGSPGIRLYKKSQIVRFDLASLGPYGLLCSDYTHPVGLGSPAHLHAELAGP